MACRQYIRGLSCGKMHYQEGLGIPAPMTTFYWPRKMTKKL